MSRITDQKLLLARRISWVYGFIIATLPLNTVLTTWAGSNFGHRYVFVVWKELLILASLPFVVYLGLANRGLIRAVLKDWLFRLILIYFGLHCLMLVYASWQGDFSLRASAYAMIINLRFLGFFVATHIVASYCGLLKKYWFKLLTYPSFGVVGFGLVQKLLPADFLKHFGYGSGTIPAYQTVDQKIEYTRLQSTMRGSNPLGAYLAFVLPSYYYIRPKAKALILSLAAGVVLFFSYSRSGWVGLLLSGGLLIYLLNRQPKFRKAVLIGGVGLVIVGAIGLALGHTSKNLDNTLFHTDNSSKSVSSSNASRLTAIKKGWNDVIHQPLGRGPGTAGPASQLGNMPPRIAENYFLQLGQEVGVLGVALFVTINFIVGQRLWRKRNDKLAVFLFASLIGITLINMVSHAWTDESLSLIWWGLAGVALAPSDIMNKVRK